jgi:hypothetical protein
VGGLQLAFLIAAAVALTASMIALFGLGRDQANQGPAIGSGVEALS